MSDEAETKQGELERQTPAEGEAKPSTERLYTKEERDQYASNKLAEQGRKHKAEVDGHIAKLSQAETKAKDLEDKLEELETNGVKDPDAKSVLELKKQLRKERATIQEQQEAIKRDRDALAADKTELETWKATKRATAIAARYEGVDVQELIDLTDGSEEKMESLAKRLAKAKEKPPQVVPAKPGSNGALSDEAFWKAAAENPGRYNSLADLKRLKEIRDKRLQGG